jgi:CarD family transcriptional regulator
MMFKIGDLAVYPAQGVGTVDAIESKQVAGHHVTFYVLRIRGKETVIRIPTANAKAVGLRKLIEEKQVSKVFDILRARPDGRQDCGQTWNKRFRDYHNKLKSGSVFEIAEVLRDLFLLKNDKELSFGERKLFETALTLLTKELSIVMASAEANVENQLRGLLQTKN